jgi:hypothetical protein
MKWKTDGIDKILASSQVMLSSPGLTPDANIGPFSVMLLLPTLIGVEKLPDGATLHQVLPPTVYARWNVQRQRWATGNAAALKSSLERKPEDPCWEGITNISFIKDLGIEDLVASINEAWLKAAERSLTENQQSFAVLEMSDVLLPNGLLAMLKAKGYTVLGPADAT